MEITDADIDQFLSLSYNERKKHLTKSYKIAKILATNNSSPLFQSDKDFLFKTVAILLQITEGASHDEDDWLNKDDNQRRIMELVSLLEKKIRSSPNDILSIYLYLRMVTIFLKREPLSGSNMRDIDLDIDSEIKSISNFIENGSYHDPANDEL